MQQPDKTGTSDAKLDARTEILNLLEHSPIPRECMLSNLGLYTRSVMLSKTLYLNELYEMIVGIPGVIMEFGCWWGSNLALFSSLRNIYEPYNSSRKVIGFDTFAGYKGKTVHDGSSLTEGEFAATADHVEAVLKAQEEDNVQSHLKKYELVSGDVRDTTRQYFEKHPETIVALAYFDIGFYGPNLICLDAIKKHLIKGSILAMDHLNNKTFPGEQKAFNEIFGNDRLTIRRSRYLPDRSYAIIS